MKSIGNDESGETVAGCKTKTWLTKLKCFVELRGTAELEIFLCGFATMSNPVHIDAVISSNLKIKILIMAALINLTSKCRQMLGVL